MGNDSKKTEWPRLESLEERYQKEKAKREAPDKKEKAKRKPAHRSTNFARWLCNELVKMLKVHVERKRARRAEDLASKRLQDLRRRHFRDVDRGAATLQKRIEYLRRETELYNAESNLSHEHNNLCDILRLMREQIVQAWYRHADRAAKRCAQASDAERHRIMRGIAELYAVFCLVDDFYLVQGSVDIGFVYDEIAKARRSIIDD